MIRGDLGNYILVKKKKTNLHILTAKRGGDGGGKHQKIGESVCPPHQKLNAPNRKEKAPHFWLLGTGWGKGGGKGLTIGEKKKKREGNRHSRGQVSSRHRQARENNTCHS